MKDLPRPVSCLRPSWPFVAALLVFIAGLAGAGEPPAIELKTVKLEAVKKAIAAPKGKLVLVDVWADFCLPCKKEFPHLVELSEKYGDRLVCISVCVDEVKDRPAALKFLQKQKAGFANYLLNEEAQAWQDHWNIVAIPAAFLYRDGQLIARFDYDDPDNQFTYADVEKAVARHLRR